MIGSGLLLQVYATLAASLLVSAAGVYFNLLTGEPGIPVFEFRVSACDTMQRAVQHARMTSHGFETRKLEPCLQGSEVLSA